MTTKPKEAKTKKREQLKADAKLTGSGAPDASAEIKQAPIVGLGVDQPTIDVEPDTQFPKTLAAAAKLRDAEENTWPYQWQLGWALVEECGPPGETSANNGSYDKLHDAKKALDKAGFDYSFRLLEEFRSIAAKFRPEDVFGAVSIYAHIAAGNLETLEAAKRQADKTKKKLTVGFVQNYTASIRRKSRNTDTTAIAADVENQALKAINSAIELINPIENNLAPYVDKLTKRVDIIDGLRNLETVAKQTADVLEKARTPKRPQRQLERKEEHHAPGPA
jgi:hypothetical protein